VLLEQGFEKADPSSVFSNYCARTLTLGILN